jgi:hypothetical protein
MAVSLEQYLKNESTVKQARSKAAKAKAALANAQRAAAGVPASAGAEVSKQVKDALATAQALFNEAEQSRLTAEATATSFYNTNRASIDQKALQETKSTDEARLKDAIKDREALARAGQDVSLIDSKINDLNQKITNTGKYAPQQEGTTTATQAEGKAKVTFRDYATEATNVPTALKKLSDAERLDLANKLNAAGFKAPTTGVYNDQLRDAYQQAILSNQARSQEWQEEIDFGKFLDLKKIETNAIKGLGGGATTTVSISSPSEAAGYINQVFQSLLGRYATPEEIKKLTPKLNKAEKDNPSKTVNGVSTGGIDRGQFLTDIILATPEYKQRKESKQGTIRQDLANTAKANGLDLDKNFGSSVEGWVKRIESGEKADAFKQLIRNTAKLGLPDKVGALLDQGVDLETVFSPYKNAMAATLEINPETISLSDPTLRAAIGPDKEMPLYEFQKALRKDARWQYTNNAKADVFQGVKEVFSNFGIMEI